MIVYPTAFKNRQALSLASLWPWPSKTPHLQVAMFISTNYFISTRCSLIRGECRATDCWLTYVCSSTKVSRGARMRSRHFDPEGAIPLSAVSSTFPYIWFGFILQSSPSPSSWVQEMLDPFTEGNNRSTRESMSRLIFLEEPAYPLDIIVSQSSGS